MTKELEQELEIPFVFVTVEEMKEDHGMDELLALDSLEGVSILYTGVCTSILNITAHIPLESKGGHRRDCEGGREGPCQVHQASY